MLIPYIRIVRPINIFIIAITQIIFHYLLIVPLLLINGSATSLSHFQFLLLVISTTMIAAGGYIINDIKDIKVDLINKPERVIINNQISRADGLKLYVTLTAFGILIALYLAYSIQLMALGAIHFLSAGLLFFYSTSYKKIFLLGTFIISLITALSIFIVLLFDLNAMSNTVIIKFVIIYSIFAFLITFIREILKDAEDIDGDTFQKAATLPIVLGIKTSKTITAFLIGIIITLVLVLGRYLLIIEDYISMIYVTVAVVFPLFFLFYKTLNAFNKHEFATASNLAKLIMVLGVLYIPVFYLVLFQIK